MSHSATPARYWGGTLGSTRVAGEPGLRYVAGIPSSSTGLAIYISGACVLSIDVSLTCPR